MSSSTRPTSITVAIIGAGISGLVLALALKERNIPFHIYEQAHGFSELGAGLNFNPAGLRALRASSLAAFEAYTEVRAPHHPKRNDFYFAYTDGERVFELTTEDGHGAVRRSKWIEKLAEHVPSEYIDFRKRLDDLTEMDQGALKLKFEDGSEATADVLIGCDGIKSKVRPFVVGKHHPSAEPSFSHNVVYRSMITRADARRVMGPELAESAHIRSGDGICYVSYPVTGGEFNSFGIFRPHPDPWPHYPSVTAATTKQALKEDITNPFFKDVADLLTDELDMWAIYDSADHPLPTYSKGHIALVGDSAHSSTPNLGAGAGMSIEDAVVLAELLSTGLKKETINQPRDLTFDRLAQALASYSSTRMERSQWLVDASRRLGDMNVRRPRSGGCWTFDEYERETVEGYHKVWRGQIDEMIQHATGIIGTS